MLNSTSH